MSMKIRMRGTPQKWIPTGAILQSFIPVWCISVGRSTSASVPGSGVPAHCTAQRGPGLPTSNRWSSARRQGKPLDCHHPCHCCCGCCCCCFCFCCCCCYCCCCWCCWLLVLWWCCRSSPLVPVLLLRWCGHWGPAPGIRHPSSSPVESRPPRGGEACMRALMLHSLSILFYSYL